jgi:lipid-A-disaccharide synthase
MSLCVFAASPNILSREFVVPELLQDAATPEALAQSVLLSG